MTNWIDRLKDDLKTEFGDKPPTAVFATVRFVQNVPTAAARTVVVRDIGTHGEMLVTSDARSQKNVEIKQTSGATLLFWCASTKRQFRVAGSVDPSVENRQAVWVKLSDRARGLFAWPAPGSPRDDTDVFAEKLPANAAIPASFEVLRLTPSEVETLDLNGHPHDRKRWTRTGDRWSAERVNP